MTGEIDTKGSKAVIYCRVSTKEQGDTGQSLTVQEKFCRRMCEAQEWEVSKVYKEDFTGTTWNRPQFLSMCQDIEDSVYEDKPIQFVVVYDTSRFTRGGDLERGRRKIKPALLAFAVSGMVATDDNEMLDLGLSVNTKMDEHQVKKIRERTRGSMKELKDKWIHVGTPAKFAISEDIHLLRKGCVRETDYTVKDDLKGIVVQRMACKIKSERELWFMASEGYSPEQCAAEWGVKYSTFRDYLSSRYGGEEHVLPERLKEYQRRFRAARAAGNIPKLSEAAEERMRSRRRKVSERCPSETVLETAETVSERVGVGKGSESPENPAETSVGKDGVE